MEELKAELIECAASMSVDEIVEAINASAAAGQVDDPLALAAWLKSR